MSREGEVLMAVAVEVAHLHVAIVVREWWNLASRQRDHEPLPSPQKDHRTRSRSLAGRAVYDVRMAVAVHIGDREALAPLT
jgi:hypothetical protein